MTATCETCGKTFARKASRVGRFCSRPCGDAASKGRPADPAKQHQQVCPGCGKTFRVFEWRKVTHCSRECWLKATNSEYVCENCGVTYVKNASHKGRKFGSMACYGTAQDKGGAKYYGGNWAAQRLLAIARDGDRCVDCSVQVKPLHVHHIVGIREFGDEWRSANELSNLVSVCPSCHLKRHGGQYH